MNKRLIWIVLSCLMFVASIVLIVYYLWGNGYLIPAKTAPESETYAEFTYPSIDESAIADLTKITTTDPTESTAEPGGSTEPTETRNPAQDFVCPVDFDELTHANPDIIGWIYMSKPEISLPILRNLTDDTWYLYHDAVGRYKREGSLFVEHEYNRADFSDPMTVIYGHRMSSGSMFGTLQATLSESGYFDEDRFIVVFTQNATKVYQIFATLPSDNAHLLYYNDFHTEEVYEAFISDIFGRSGMDVHLVSKARPSYGDRILVLSSCLWGDRTKRYLVFAKEIQ